ncbi:MAG: replication-associated recombination protein A [Chlamydiales bacterium]|nr:replication-associated recombination protein A [Chlamydiales bacterium]
MPSPLADQIRPQELCGVVGQEHLVGTNGFLTRLIANNKPLSLILWGPPGCGKTTLARLYAKAFNARFINISAVFSGVTDLKKIIEEAESRPLFQKQTILFVDEIHRFNKAQQDAFLPYLENGRLTLVGATTENPSFSLNNALLSRVRVLTLNALDHPALMQLIESYEAKHAPLPLEPEAKRVLIELAGGDGRYLFNLIENLCSVEKPLSSAELLSYLQRRSPLFDKKGDGHYNLISALHKAVRGSDPDASLYWFARILEGGEDPLFLARRIIRMASEDIGLADPEALKLALSARDAYQMLGSPEGELALAEAVVYLALAPKSNALYRAYGKAREAAEKTSQLNPPKIILNAPTNLMKEIGYGKGYVYDHETDKGFSGQDYFPGEMKREVYYEPVERGFERDLKKRIDYFKKIRNLNST